MEVPDGTLCFCRAPRCPGQVPPQPFLAGEKRRADFCLIGRALAGVLCPGAQVGVVCLFLAFFVTWGKLNIFVRKRVIIRWPSLSVLEAEQSLSGIQVSRSLSQA